MLQIGGDLDLSQESLGAEHRGQLRSQHFYRDFAVVLKVLGEIHRGHTALPQLPLDPVAVGEGGGESRVDGQSPVVCCESIVCRSAAEAATRLVSLK